MILHSQACGRPTLLIDGPHARCEISLAGGQVLSFVPREEGRDLLWLSDGWHDPGRPLRGGMPLCWPWFARQNVPPSAPQHGFARTAPWLLEAATEGADGVARLELSMKGADEGGPAHGWPAQCTARLEVRVGRSLQVTLITDNHSEREVSLTQALHTYFRVGDVREARIEGLEGRSYLDKLLDFAECPQEGPWRFDQACDRIYMRSATRHVLVDPVLRRRIVIESEHSASTVVWNPGPAGVREFSDIAPADWHRFVCIEAGNCLPADPVVLEPGTQARLTQRLSLAE